MFFGFPRNLNLNPNPAPPFPNKIKVRIKIKKENPKKWNAPLFRLPAGKKTAVFSGKNARMRYIAGGG
jgi:hypothetical protein